MAYLISEETYERLAKMLAEWETLEIQRTDSDTPSIVRGNLRTIIEIPKTSSVKVPDHPFKVIAGNNGFKMKSGKVQLVNQNHEAVLIPETTISLSQGDYLWVKVVTTGLSPQIPTCTVGNGQSIPERRTHKITYIINFNDGYSQGGVYENLQSGTSYYVIGQLAEDGFK